MTIEDVENLPKGERLDVIIFDERFEESAYEMLVIVHDSDEPAKAEEIHCHARHTYTKGENLGGTLFYQNGDEECEDDDRDGIVISDFYFDLWIEHNGKCSWQKVVNGYTVCNGKHWSEYPKNTKVGRDGNLMRWSDHSKLPDILPPREGRE